jgi:hypothetical protein
MLPAERSFLVGKVQHVQTHSYSKLSVEYEIGYESRQTTPTHQRRADFIECHTSTVCHGPSPDQLIEWMLDGASNIV